MGIKKGSGLNDEAFSPEFIPVFYRVGSEVSAKPLNLQTSH